MAELNELRSDRTELKGLLEQAKRPRVRVVLQNELSSVDSKIHEIERQRLQDEVASMDSDDKENPSVPDAFEGQQKAREGRVQRSKITSYDSTLRNATNSNNTTGTTNSNKEGRFPCQATGCSYVCRWQCEMKVHMNKHTKERPYVCDWANCGKSFGDKSSMRTHYNAVHLKLKKFKCHVKGCSLSFTCAKSRNRHSRNTKLHEKLFSGQCFRDQYMCVNHTAVPKEEKPTKKEPAEDLKGVEESRYEKEQIPSPMAADYESKFYLDSPNLTNPMGLMFLNHPSMYSRGDYYLYKDLFSKALMKEYSMYGYGLSGAGFPGFYLPAARASVIKENNAGFLQKPQTITIYVDLANVGSLHRDQIQVDYGRRSLNIVINNLNGKTYELNLPNLGGEIVPEKCKHKNVLRLYLLGHPKKNLYACHFIGALRPACAIKPNTITVILKKARDGDWAGISATEAKEKKAREEKTRMGEVDKDRDPSESLMDLMKKMYDEGDDEMKRTIAKAWTESREKQAAGSMI